ncbi:hypothetical protein [Hydrogenophaga aquatica]
MSTIASLPAGGLNRPAANAAAPKARRTESSRPLAALLLAAAVAALAVVADQLIATWADGHLMAAWVAMWAVVFAGTLLLAGTARRMSQRVMAGLDAWARRRAEARAEARYLALAQSDARVMADLQAARDRYEIQAAAAATEKAAADAPAYDADAARSANVDQDIEYANTWLRRYRNVYYV